MDQGLEPIAEIDILWIIAGLGCDGETIALTAATQPALDSHRALAQSGGAMQCGKAGLDGCYRRAR
jgi:hypothetical protein